MSSATSKTYPEAVFRIIHRDTIGACIQIFQQAERYITRNRGEDTVFLLLELDKALTLAKIEKYTSRWPAIAEVGSRVDQYFQSVLADAKLWVSRLANLNPEVDGMRIYLTPFPVFKSCYLRVGAYGLVRNRRLVALSNKKEYRGLAITIEELGGACEHISIFFHEMLHVAGWMCEDPERRLYTKRFDLLPSKHSKAHSVKGLVGNGKVSVTIRTDGESEADSEPLPTPTTTRSTSPQVEE